MIIVVGMIVEFVVVGMIVKFVVVGSFVAARNSGLHLYYLRLHLIATIGHLSLTLCVQSSQLSVIGCSILLLLGKIHFNNPNYWRFT